MPYAIRGLPAPSRGTALPGHAAPPTTPGSLSANIPAWLPRLTAPKARHSAAERPS